MEGQTDRQTWLSLGLLRVAKKEVLFWIHGIFWAHWQNAECAYEQPRMSKLKGCDLDRSQPELDFSAGTGTGSGIPVWLYWNRITVFKNLVPFKQTIFFI